MQYLIYVAQGSRVLTSITRKRKDMARDSTGFPRLIDHVRLYGMLMYCCVEARSS